MGKGWKRALGTLVGASALLGVMFLLGVVAPFMGIGEEVVYLTHDLSFRPAEQPLLNGLFFLLNTFVLLGAITVGWLGVALLIRFGLLFYVGAAGMLGAGFFGLVLALFGDVLMGLSGDQRGGMAMVAVFLGGLGVMMWVAIIRDLLRQRRIRARSRAAS